MTRDGTSVDRPHEVRRRRGFLKWFLCCPLGAADAARWDAQSQNSDRSLNRRGLRRGWRARDDGSRLSSPGESNGMNVFAEGGTAVLEQITVHQMRSIWAP